ncbi:MAG: response regulator [Rhizobacter sp.]|nr:response regulator [Ferruginibacter sp.]
MQQSKEKNKPCDVLLIDHDIDEHFLLESSLGEIGLNKKLRSFNSGRTAINYLDSLFRNDFPALIIVDFNMPLMNGREVLQYLKYTYRYARIPVIVHSTKMTECIKCDLMEIGAVACFRKTFCMKELKIYLAALAIIFDNQIYR